MLASGLSDVKPRRPAEKPEITPKATRIQKITLNTKLELDMVIIYYKNTRRYKTI
tara:strand:+ start:2416 stop:2580 length:165 start_codon:yes stop_codon:yes gene_type:complete